MANSYTEVTLSAQQQNGFTTPAYIKQEHLKVYVNNVLVDGNTSVFGTLTTTANLTYSFVTTTATSLNFSEPLPTNTIVRIDRNSSQNARLNDYSDASLLTADVMDQDANQMFFVAQEALDQASKTNLAAGTFYYAQGTAPTSVAVGTVWFNTDSSPNTLQVWCGDTEGWRFVAPVHETTRYTNASGIGYSTGHPTDGTFQAYAGLAQISDTGFNSSSYFHLNGVKQVSGTLAEVNATPATADYVFDQASNTVWFKPITATDVIVIESFSGSFSQEVTDKEAAAQVAKQAALDAQTAAETAQGLSETAKGLSQEYATKAENSTVTGTSDYSALHWMKKAEDEKDAAVVAKNTAVTAKEDAVKYATTDASSTFTDSAGTSGLKSALRYASEAATSASSASTSASTATDKATDSQKYADTAHNTTFTDSSGASGKNSALHYATEAAASASAAATSATDATAVTVGTGQTVTGAKVFSANTDFGAGIDVTGTVTADGITVGTGNNELKLTTSNNDAYFTQTTTTGNVHMRADNFLIEDQDGGNYRINCGDSDGVKIYGGGDNNTLRMITGVDGSFYGEALTDTIQFFTGSSGTATSASDRRMVIKNTGINVTGNVGADGFKLYRNDGVTESLDIFTDSNNDTFITENNTDADGSLKILGAALQLRADDLRLMNRAGTETYFEGDADGAAKLFYDSSTHGTAKLETTATGINVTGTVTADALNLGHNEKATFNGNLEIYSAGNNSYIKEIDAAGNFTIQGGTFAGKDSEEKNRISWDGDNTFLFYKNGTAATLNAGETTEVAAGDSAERLRTQGTGVKVTGTVTADSLDIDGTVDVDTGNTIFDVDTGTSTVHFKSTNLGEQFLIENNNGGSTLEGAPDLTLYCNQPNDVADDDTLGVINFKGLNDATPKQDYIYAKLFAVAQDVSDGDEKGRIIARIQHSSGGTPTSTNALEIHKDGITVDGTVTADGITSSEDINIAHTKDLVFRNAADDGDQLVIKTSGNTSYIQELGSDHLWITGDRLILAETASSNDYRIIVGDSNGVKLYADDTNGVAARRLKTTANNVTISTGVYDNITDIVTVSSTGIDVIGTVTADALTMGNNEKITLGDPAALEIYHTGGNSFIDDVGTGSLNLRASNHVQLLGYSTGATLAKFNENGQSELYHNGVKHLNTDANGVTVTGTVTATSITASQTAEIDTTDKTMANFKGQKVIHTGTTATYYFPDVAVGDKGTTWTVVNAGTGDITISRASGATPNFSKLVTSSNPSSLTGLTLAKGGTIEMVVTAADTITCFGSGF